MQLRFFLILGLICFVLPSVMAVQYGEGTVLGSNDGTVNVTLLTDVNLSSITFGENYIQLDDLENSLLYNNSLYAFFSDYTGSYNITVNGSYGILQNSSITAKGYAWTRYLYKFNDSFNRPNNSTVGNGWIEQDGASWTSISSNNLLIASASNGNGRVYNTGTNLTKYWESTGKYKSDRIAGSYRHAIITEGNAVRTGYNFESYNADGPQAIREVNTKLSSWTDVETDNTYYNYRFRRINNTIYWKNWLSSSSEPSSWDGTATTTTTINSNNFALFQDSTADLYFDDYNLKGNNYDGVSLLFNTGSNDLETNFTYDILDSNQNYILTSNKTSIQLITSGIYYFRLNQTGYNQSIERLDYTAGTETAILFNVIEGNRVNATFYNEVTNQPLTGVNVTWRVINNNVGFNGTTTNSSTGEISVSPGLNEIIYSADGFYERRYFVTLGSDERADLRLYLINQSDSNVEQLDYTVIDDNFGGVSNATIKLLRRYTENGAVITRIVEMSKSDINGQGYLHLQKLTGDYQFVIEYLGNTVLTTSVNTIKDSTTTLRIELRENVIDSVVYNNVITKNISYDSTNREFVLYYNDPNNVVNQICFIVDRVVGSGFVNVNSTCTSLSTGTIRLGIGPQNGTYTAYAYIDTNTQFSEHPFLTYSITINSFTKNALGIFLIVGLVVSIALAGMFLSNGNPTIVLSLFGAGIFIGSFFLGLAVFTYTTVILLLFGIAWIIFMIRRRGE